MTRRCTCKATFGHTAECEVLFPQPILTDGQRWLEEKEELQKKLAEMEAVYISNVDRLAQAYQDDLTALRSQLDPLKKGLYIAMSALVKIGDVEEDIAAECLAQTETDKSRHLRLLQKHFEAVEEALGKELYAQVKQGRI